MDLFPTPEQQEIVAAAAAFLAKELPTSGIRERRFLPSSVERQAWSKCAELGWFGLGLSEAQGGVGYGLAEEALLFREVGRYLAPGPFLATTIGARLAAIAGASDIVTTAMTGGAVIGLAEPHHSGAVVGAVVDGAFDVLDGVGAPYLLAVSPTGAALVSVDALPPVVSIPCIDPAVRLGRVEIRETPAVAYLPAEPAGIFDRASVLAAAMLVGIAEATRDMSAEYAKVRVQFGKPIGVHQAIKHRCADMAVRAEAARSQMLFAALSIDEDRPDAPLQAASAKIVATDAAISNAADNVQIHGGMGYTFEHDAHLYVKRAHVYDRSVGDSRLHLARLMDLPPAQY
jgi:alkylation response protein AidB-like acyl-CoA dehydrogenase